MKIMKRNQTPTLNYFPYKNTWTSKFYITAKWPNPDIYNYLFSLKNAYFGETNKIVEYFDSVGVTIAEGFNPADFICKLLVEKKFL